MSVNDICTSTWVVWYLSDWTPCADQSDVVSTDPSFESFAYGWYRTLSTHNASSIHNRIQSLMNRFHFHVACWSWTWHLLGYWPRWCRRNDRDLDDFVHDRIPRCDQSRAWRCLWYGSPWPTISGSLDPIDIQWERSSLFLYRNWCRCVRWFWAWTWCMCTCGNRWLLSWSLRSLLSLILQCSRARLHWAIYHPWCLHTLSPCSCSILVRIHQGPV